MFTDARNYLIMNKLQNGSMEARKCIRVAWFLNIYRRRPGSTTYSFSQKKAFDFCTAIAKTWELTHIKNLSTKNL
jgi:hypothetical protein